MSGSAGSYFGVGPYGRGPYSRNPLAAGEVPVKAASRIAIRTDNWRNAGVSIGAGASIAIAGTILWEKIAIPPCQPWTLIASGGCYRALANTAGAMFP